ncbi:hypothetical protein [Sediminicola sp. 1XM1-17]|uniref:hypothetical protein n=1 Tax=Sediminicola sp. 1XM1-17 TaxID=3127702 RepID=UPI00307762B6
MKEKDKHSGFKTPEGYFEGFNESLMDKIKEQSHSIPKNDGMTVPDGYFESLNQQILSKAKAGETKVIPLHNNYKKYYLTAIAVAASLLLIIGLQWKNENAYTFDDLAASEIEQYFEAHDFDMTSYEIAEIMPIDDLQIEDMLLKEIKDENIADYLNDNIDMFEELNLENHDY